MRSKIFNSPTGEIISPVQDVPFMSPIATLQVNLMSHAELNLNIGCPTPKDRIKIFYLSKHSFLKNNCFRLDVAHVRIQGRIVYSSKKVKN